MNTATDNETPCRSYPTAAELLAEFPPPPPVEEWKFIEDLHYLQSENLHSNKNIAAQRAVSIINQFPDPDKRFSTALEHLTKTASNIRGSRNSRKAYQVFIKQGSTTCFEEYLLEVTPEMATVTANDCEGIRRGVYAIADMLRASQGNLPCGKWNRKPWLKTRISRCFFSPVKRWPVNTDELLDDVNYYPDGYLNRLALEGINGLWMVVALSELTGTSFTPRDPLADRRIAKLQQTIRQCARYGIKIYLFCIEPFSLHEDAPLVQAHPEMFGARIHDKRTFCPSSPSTRRYLEELTFGVFKQVPELGGLINITHGERPTTCLSSLEGTQNIPVKCPACGKRKHGEIIKDSLSAMAAGIKKAAPAAKLFAWFYCPLPEKHAPWAHTLGASVPPTAIAQFNFESGGEKRQLSRLHRGGDYWLSYVGPSRRFVRQAHAARKAGVAVSAKLQVGCGHELGTVPYIPVPELLYRKFKAMHKLGVEHAMFCWYVGNYPGLMNYTGGQLAFEDFKDAPRDFIRNLAETYSGGTDSKLWARAWEDFTKAYEHMPFSLMFQYYGPQNTGLAWQLSLYPYLRPLSPPWKPNFPPSGDAIGEALAGFSLSEALLLMQKVNDGWQKGMQWLKKGKILRCLNHELKLDLYLAEALSLHFENSVNLLRFYQLRSKLFSGVDEKASLQEMRILAEREANLSMEMMRLCKKDTRLGFHSEALCHRYYPSLLKQRAEHIRNVIIPQFGELENALESGKTAWEQFIARDDAPSIITQEAWQVAGKNCFAWRFLIDKDSFLLQIKKLEPTKNASTLAVYFIDAEGITFPLRLRFNWEMGQIALHDENWQRVIAYPTPLSASGQYDCLPENIASLKWPLDTLPAKNNRIRLNLCLGVQFAAGGYENRLYLDNFSPEQALLLEW